MNWFKTILYKIKYFCSYHCPKCGGIMKYEKEQGNHTSIYSCTKCGRYFSKRY